MAEDNITVLNENSWGIRQIKTDLKKRSRVDVVNKYGDKLATYRFNNIPLYEHPYMSWQNLDCCNGWMHDEDYLLTAVQEGKKLVAGVWFSAENEDEIKKSVEDVESSIDSTKESFAIEDESHNGPRIDVNAVIARKGTIADFYNIDEIEEAYKRQDITIDREELEKYVHIELMELYARHYSGYDYGNPRTETELIVCGLGLGYPLETTAYILKKYWGMK